MKINPINIFWNARFGMNAYLHSLILLSILTCFFILYISKLTSGAFTDEVNSIIGDQLGPIVTDIRVKYNIGQNNSVTTIINELQETVKKPYDLTESINSGLFNTITSINVILWIFFVIGVLIIRNCSELNNIDIFLVMVENLMVFTFIGVIEYLFFTKVAFKYIPVAPSFISKQFVEMIRTKFS